MMCASPMCFSVVEGSAIRHRSCAADSSDHCVLWAMHACFCPPGYVTQQHQPPSSSITSAAAAAGAASACASPQQQQAVSHVRWHLCSATTAAAVAAAVSTHHHQQQQQQQPDAHDAAAPNQQQQVCALTPPPGKQLPGAGGGTVRRETLPPPAAPPAAAAKQQGPQQPPLGSADQYQLPYAALRCGWPDAVLHAMLCQQAECLYDAHLPTPPRPAAAAVPQQQQQEQGTTTSLAGQRLLTALNAAVQHTQRQVAAAVASAAPAAPGAPPPAAASDKAAAGAVASSSRNRSSSGVRIAVHLQVPRLLVGHRSDWLQVPASYLPLWQQLGFKPPGGPKTLAYVVLCPAECAALAGAFMKELSVTFAAHNLGSLLPLPAPNQPPQPPPGAAAAAGAAAGCGVLSAAALTDAAAGIIPIGSSSSGGWLSGLAAALRQLQLRLLSAPPRLLFPPPAVCPSPRVDASQKGGLAVLLVVPDAPWGAGAPRHSSEVSGSGSSVGGVGSHGGSASHAAAAAAAAGGGWGDKGSSSQPQLNDLLLASYSLAAEYLAPLTGAVTLSSQQQAQPPQQQQAQPPQQQQAQPQQQQQQQAQAQQQVPNSSATNYMHAAGPARLPPRLALLPAAGSSSGWSGVGVGPFGRRQSLPLVLQCVTRSEVCRGSEAGLCALAMSVFNKAKRGRSRGDEGVLFPAAPHSTLHSSQQQPQPSSSDQSTVAAAAGAAGGAGAAQQAGGGAGGSGGSQSQQQQPSQVHEDVGGSGGSLQGTGGQASAAAPDVGMFSPRTNVSPSAADRTPILAPWVLNSPSYQQCRSLDTQQQHQQQQPLDGRAMHEPAFQLAAVQQQQQQPQARGTAAAPASSSGKERQQQQCSRTLHCCYAWQPPRASSAAAVAGASTAIAAGCRWLALAWTDSRAELLQSRLCEIPPALLTAAAAAAAAAEPSDASGPTAAAALSGWVAATVLAHSLQLAADIAGSIDPEAAVISSLCITRLALSSGSRWGAAGEEAAWQGLAADLANPGPQQQGVHWLQQLLDSAGGGSSMVGPAPAAAAAEGAGGAARLNTSSEPRQQPAGQPATPPLVAAAAAAAAAIALGGGATTGAGAAAGVSRSSKPQARSSNDGGVSTAVASTASQQQQRVWGELLQQLSAALGAVAAAAAKQQARRPLTVALHQLGGPAGAGCKDITGAPCFLSSVRVTALTAAVPVCVGDAAAEQQQQLAAAVQQQPQQQAQQQAGGPAALLLMPGLLDMQDAQHGAPAVDAAGGSHTASVVLLPGSSTTNCWFPGELGAARLLHLRLLAAVAAMPADGWSAAAAVAASRAGRAGSSSGDRRPRRSGRALLLGGAGVHDQQQRQAAASAKRQKSSSSDGGGAEDVREQQQQQQAAVTPPAAGCGALAEGGGSSSGVKRQRLSGVFQAASGAADSPAGVGPADAPRQQGTAVAAAVSGAVLAPGTITSGGLNPAAVLADAAASLAPLCAAGAAVHGLHGYRAQDHHPQLTTGGGCVSTSGAGESGDAASSAHLPLHAGVSRRLWLLACSLDGEESVRACAGG